MKKVLLSCIVFVLVLFSSAQQIDLQSGSYNKPLKLVIKNISFKGIKQLDDQGLGLITKLSVGETISIPSDKLSDAIKALWKQGLFSDIQLEAYQADAEGVNLVFSITENNRLSKFSFINVKKNDQEKLREELETEAKKLIEDSAKKVKKSKESSTSKPKTAKAKKEVQISTQTLYIARRTSKKANEKDKTGAAASKSKAGGDNKGKK